MPGALTPSFPSRGLALAMLLASQCAGAVGLGEIEVGSALGEALDARIPLALAPGKAADASCFSLARDARDGAVPTLVQGALTLERAPQAASLRIRSPVAISEPALSLRIRAACPGQPDQEERQYTVLLDPRPGTQGVTALPVIGASLAARPGDTLASIAGQVFPQGRWARTQYLLALREANPGLARHGDGPLPVGAPIALPDLRTYARGRAAAVSSAPASGAGLWRAAAVPAVPPAVAATATAPFMLKLSSPEADLTRTRGMDDRKRAQLRERLALLEEDDRVAALLALRSNVRQLESRIAQLQLDLASMPPDRATAADPRPPSAARAASAQAATEAEAIRRPASESTPLWKEYLTAPWAWGLLVVALLAAVLMRRPRRVIGDDDPTPSAMLPSPPPAKAPPPADREAPVPTRRAAAANAGRTATLPDR